MNAKQWSALQSFNGRMEVVSETERSEIARKIAIIQQRTAEAVAEIERQKEECKSRLLSLTTQKG